MNIDTLRSLQLAYAKLLHDKSLYDIFNDDVNLFSRMMGLPKSALKLIDLDPEKHLSELYSRRGMLAREVGARTPNLLKVLGYNEETKIQEFQNSELFCEFLASDYFLNPKYALPSPECLGHGYENYTKFFVWMLLSSKDKFGQAVLDSLSMDIAFFLVGQANHATNNYYQKFKKGVYWVVSNYVYFINAEYQLYQIDNMSFIEIFNRSGVFDLETIKADFLTTEEKENE